MKAPESDGCSSKLRRKRIDSDWSRQSPHIRTLFRPWQPGDGYDEATLQTAEARLGVRLPTILRTFYRVWGRRRDLTKMRDALLAPEDVELRADALIFCAENQASYYWGVRYEALAEANPPVVVTASGPQGWQDESRLHWRASHAQVADFLDDLTYLHAFCGGAVHGGHTDLFPPPAQAHHLAWLEQHWRTGTVTARVFGMIADPQADWICPPLYIRDGQALPWFLACSAVAQTTEALDEIGQALQITWTRRW